VQPRLNIAVFKLLKQKSTHQACKIGTQKATHGSNPKYCVSPGDGFADYPSHSERLLFLVHSQRISDQYCRELGSHGKVTPTIWLPNKNFGPICCLDRSEASLEGAGQTIAWICPARQSN
jgi:hypothetical protein